MKTKLSLILISAALTCGIISCGQHTSEAKKMDEPTEKPGINITPADLAIAKDPACGMSLEGAKISDTAVYEGKVYGFCSEACKGEFKKEPAKYAVK